MSRCARLVRAGGAAMAGTAASVSPLATDATASAAAQRWERRFFMGPDPSVGGSWIVGRWRSGCASSGRRRVVEACDSDLRIGHAIEDVADPVHLLDRGGEDHIGNNPGGFVLRLRCQNGLAGCLLYTSDAADDLLCVDLGGR